jgi:hypothetical protein
VDVSRFAFYASLDRPPCERDRQDRELTRADRRVPYRVAGHLWAPRIDDDLADAGVPVDRKPVAPADGRRRAGDAARYVAPLCSAISDQRVAGMLAEL